MHTWAVKSCKSCYCNWWSTGNHPCVFKLFTNVLLTFCLTSYWSTRYKLYVVLYFYDIVYLSCVNKINHWLMFQEVVVFRLNKNEHVARRCSIQTKTSMLQVDVVWCMKNTVLTLNNAKLKGRQEGVNVTELTVTQAIVAVGSSIRTLTARGPLQIRDHTDVVTPETCNISMLNISVILFYRQHIYLDN